MIQDLRPFPNPPKAVLERKVFRHQPGDHGEQKTKLFEKVDRAPPGAFY